MADADTLKGRVGHNHAVATNEPEQTGLQLVGAGTVVRIEQNQFGRVFADHRLNLPALEPENVLLKTLTPIQPDKLL
jgi:hypothetical protein